MSDPLLDAMLSQLLAARDLIDSALRTGEALRQRAAAPTTRTLSTRDPNAPPPTLGTKYREQEATTTTTTTATTPEPAHA